MRTAIGRVVSNATAAWLVVAAAQPAAAKVHPAEVLLHKDAARCVHAVDANRMKLKKSKDLAVWDVSNYGDPDKAKAECGVAQDVLLCSYVANAFNTDVFQPCASLPMGRDLNKSFTLQPGDIVRLMCLGKTEGSTFKVIVYSDDPGKLPRCPSTPPAPEEIRHHTIAIEIVP